MTLNFISVNCICLNKVVLFLPIRINTDSHAILANGALMFINLTYMASGTKSTTLVVFISTLCAP